MPLDDITLKKILLAEHYLSEKDCAQAESEAKRSRLSLYEQLIKTGLVTKDIVGQAVAESLGVPFAELALHMPSKEDIARIPEEIAIKYRVVFFSEKKNVVTIATDNPKNMESLKALEKLFSKSAKGRSASGGKKISLAFALTEHVDDALRVYKKLREPNFIKILQEKNASAPEVLEEIFMDALGARASDIHLEPQDGSIVVRFRIDGVLQEMGSFSKEHYETILNRIKVQSHLRTDEHFGAQDGSLRHKKDDKTINLRISIIPTMDGEKVVMRILTEYVRGFTLTDLGLSEHHQKMLIAAAEKPFGMILVVGPTGSGKTTTLYGLLKYLNKPDINITTIEDPVEYKIAGVNHIQVNTQTNLTFAKGLRSIVRQDPDIIFLGEIRDQESAEIAVNAALTGHLLLSTFHANDAATAIPRLLDMSIERFLLSSTLEIVISQTLVRRICESCRTSYTETRKEYVAYVKKRTLYRGKGCNACAQTGYKGRVALFEFIKNTPRLQELILRNPSTKEVWELARKEGAASMFEDGIEKVQAGVTTIDEVFRVTAPPSEKNYL
ncbi:type II/IV secretion system protein [Candidatus Uhrbacteria bacterium]|nr:type II/IV secretion system protein [Candidatus Uhrbacteria bacterium]